MPDRHATLVVNLGVCAINFDVFICKLLADVYRLLGP